MNESLFFLVVMLIGVAAMLALVGANPILPDGRHRADNLGKNDFDS